MAADSDGDGEPAGHDSGDDSTTYDPANIDLPSRTPPLRSTAPQSDFTMGQVTTGAIVAIVGLIVTFGFAFALV